VVEPLGRFARYTKGEGHINAIPDVDGILRRVPPNISFKGRSAYQLGLKSGLDILGAKDADILFSAKRHAILAKLPGNKSLSIPLDNNNQFIINWKQKWGKEFKHFSYVDVIRSYALAKKGLEPTIDLSVFKDKICVVGLTAAGLTDIKPVPVQNAYPAVGINAMIINSVLAKDFIYDLPKWCNILILLLVSIAITFYLSNLRLIGGMILAVASIACYISISVLMFVLFNVAITTIYPAMAIFLSYTFTSLYAQILQSIERARLFKQATRDGLTSLYNIRHFNLLFEAEFRNLTLDKTKRLALIMGDVDNFKQVNDTYGHQAGDIILREFAKIIQAKCRQTDIVARYGGEEFIVMLPGAGKKEAMETAERIRHDIEGRKFRLKNIVYGTTISMGVVEFSNEREKDSLIEKADKALYQAKHEGKNRVCLSSI
jgi:diguanylate cyclase (GGDEF)-like protein